MRNSLSILFALILLTGCGQDDIKVYRVPKETPAGLPAGQPAPTAQPSSPQLRWQTPAGWIEGAPSEFRVASFRIKGPDGKEADVSVVPLPGGAGGDLSNVNRWRGQVSQPPVADEELKKLAQPVELAGQTAQLYEQAGEGPTSEPLRILAVIQHRAGTAWFFKMTGNDKLVAQQKPAFIEFLRTVQFAGSAPASPPTSGNPRWAPPADWTEVAGGQFLVAKFTIAGAGGAQAAVNVSSSVGDGGGLGANVNRWRKQLGLAELAGPELARAVTMLPGGIAFVEMRGERDAVIGAIVTQPGQTWFYKLMGDPALVTAQKDPFTKFVQGVRY